MRVRVCVRLCVCVCVWLGEVAAKQTGKSARTFNVRLKWDGNCGAYQIGVVKREKWGSPVNFFSYDSRRLELITPVGTGTSLKQRIFTHYKNTPNVDENPLKNS